jgi:hypothetical protein
MKLYPYVSLREPLLAFSTGRAGSHAHPLMGLVKLGPYSRTTLPRFTPQIRIAIVGPPSGLRPRRELLRSLLEVHDPTDRRDYVPQYPGFQQLFGVELVPAPAAAQIPLPEQLGPTEADAVTARGTLQVTLQSAISRLLAVRDLFDVAVFHLPDSWSSAFRADGFDAHDELKALAATAGIPTQIVNDRTFAFPYKASRAWRLAIALYVKAGGVPWKLAALKGVPDGTAYIGLAYALRGDPRTAQFVTCCSQVFDTDGGGMQFVAYDAHDPIEDTQDARRNPFLSRDDIRAVLARSLRLYQARNAGNLPQRVVVHKTTAFRQCEIDGARDALAAVRELECLELTTKETP